ncbi:maleylpyruvate isomerase family mycothiol-dependent enzyme [Pseudonocardia sp. WMMC193]|uniref:maleylpyruvate isomerase family mycothiol-dependent enzyme n=1 Tax=Pseudonocardia sp. WMMC193 TaxID=2911965 RepID=UPI001F1AA410|nr:maleylpyruvate isomerase family mycothiol-dependent enzyme [Pseudonocardia sp. WMMC193]MCF7548257.1 maleylpyruvate isomerase family mycothiol-dependent enzyme [Pseudonocardia sp. WMMC193]
MPAAEPDCRTMARAERAALAEFLGTLSPADWDAPTLCAGWAVRDVVAHLVSYEDLSPLALVRRLARGGATANEIGIAALRHRAPDELLELVRNRLDPRGLTAAFGGRIALTDGLIHHQDIRRSFGRPREIPADRLRVVLDFARTAPPIGARQRIKGLTLRATDLDWSTGRGPLVEGPAEPLLMALAGRAGAVAELGGDGAAILAGRTG